MILTFGDVITVDEQAKILGLLASARFVDGRSTAGAAAAQFKQNQQVARDSPEYREITEVVLGALRRNETFRAHRVGTRIEPPREHAVPERIARDIRKQFPWYYETFYPGLARA